MKEISYAYGTNHFDRDPDLAAILGTYWKGFPDHRDELHRFGAFAGEDVYETVYHVDHDAAPVLVTHDLDGQRVDRARLSPAERVVLKAAAHINRPPYEGGSWHHHFALGYLMGDPGLYCVLTITNQTVYGIHKYAPSFAAWKEAMLRGDAFGATWMTEIQGGSDLGANITVARKDGDVWRIDCSRFQQVDKEGNRLEVSPGWTWNKHGYYDSHIPEVFTYVHFSGKMVEKGLK